MKKFTLLLLVLCSYFGYAQGGGFNYKALITNNGNAITNQPVDIKFTLLENATTPVYQETHTATTDSGGIVSVNIGEGTPVSGDFNAIDWGKTAYFLKVEVDTGSGYTDFGTTELKSVPYAKHATSLTLTSPDGKKIDLKVDNNGHIIRDMSGASAKESYVERLRYILRNMQFTAYTHSLDSLMDEDAGIYKYDCSGFTSEFAMKYSIPDHRTDLFAHRTTSNRPLAKDYYQYFRDTILGPGYNPNNYNTSYASNQYWKVFTDIDSLKVGDLIVVKYAQGWRNDVHDDEHANPNYPNMPSTGHIMTAWSRAIQDSEDHSLYYIKVYDAASSPHSRDSRYGANSPSADGGGVGTGWMIFKASTYNSHRPIQYKWKLTSQYFYRSYNDYFNPASDWHHRSHDRLLGIIFARPL